MKLARIISLSRPRFWSYLAGPYLIGYAIAAPDISNFFTFKFLYTVFYFLIPANFFLYGINDYFDREVDRHNPKKFNREKRLLTDEIGTLLNFLLISVIFTLPMLAYLNSYSLLVLLAFFITATFYSAPPVRFKTLPFFDSLSNVLYIIPGFLGYSQFYPLPFTLTTFVCLAAWPAAMHLFSAVADIEADRKAHITTSAVALGKTRSLVTCAILWSIFAFYVTSINPFFGVSFIYPLIALYLLYYQPEKVEEYYWKFPYVNAVIGAALFFYLIYIKFYL